MRPEQPPWLGYYLDPITNAWVPRGGDDGNKSLGIPHMMPIATKDKEFELLPGLPLTASDVPGTLRLPCILSLNSDKNPMMSLSPCLEERSESSFG